MAPAQIARKYGAIATHMAKPFADRTGSGLHVHYHLADAKTGKNLFLDESDPRGLGPVADWRITFSAACISHARALCAVTSPTVNCYKRLQLGQGLLLDAAPASPGRRRSPATATTTARR